MTWMTMPFRPGSPARSGLAAISTLLRPCTVLGALAVLLLLSGCGDDEPPAKTTFEPLAYDYLTPMPLNVGSIDIQNHFQPGPNDVGRLDPVPPVDALRQMASDRLKAFGSSGHAVFIIQDASLVRSQGNYIGSFAVEFDVYTSDNTRAGFAEARILRTRAIDGGGPTRDALYDMTKQMMDAMNVELEFQVRRSLRDWIVNPTDAAPKAVEQQPLSAPQ